VVKKEPSIITYSDNSISDSIRPILFHINDTTGEVTGCPYIRKLDKAPIMSQKADPEDKLLAKIKSQTQPRQMAESGQNEIVTGGIYNKLKTRLVCYSSFHGGALYEIRFYDEKGNLLNKHKIGGKYNVSETVAFNAAETFVTAILTNGDFWIFDTNGRIVQNGNANNYLNFGPYDMWSLNVNKSGTLILLSGQKGSVILDDKKNIIQDFGKSVNSSFFCDSSNLLFIEIGNLIVYDTSRKKFEKIAHSNTFKNGRISLNFFWFQNSTNSKIKYFYEIL